MRLKRAGVVLAWAWFTVLQPWQAQPSDALDKAPEAQPSATTVVDALRDATGAPLIDGATYRLPGGELVELAPRWSPLDPLRLLDPESGALAIALDLHQLQGRHRVSS